MWVKPTADNARNFFAADGFLFSTEAGALAFTLDENTAVWTTLDERWQYITFSVRWTDPNNEVILSRNSVKSDVSVLGDEPHAADVLHYIGTNFTKDAYFGGFIYKFCVYTAYRSDFVDFETGKCSDDDYCTNCPISTCLLRCKYN